MDTTSLATFLRNSRKDIKSQLTIYSQEICNTVIILLEAHTYKRKAASTRNDLPDVLPIRKNGAKSPVHRRLFFLHTQRFEWSDKNFE